MRMRGAGAAAHLLIVLLFVAGGALTGLEAQVGTVDLSHAATTAGAKERNQKPDRPRQGDHGGKPKHDDRARKGNGKRKPPATLDARRIAVANAGDVAATQCEGLDSVKVGERTFCSHGDDPPMFGPRGRADGDATSSEPAPPVLCVDGGTSGPRIQLVYVHRNDREDKYAELLPTFRRLASEMDDIVDQSAEKTGGDRRLRFVTDGNCQVDVQDLGARGSDVDGWGSLLQAMKKAGYDWMDRKYVMLVDADVFCGIGTFAKSDRPDTDAHDFTGYARIDRPCWDAGTMAHELGHTMGAVQYSAPHTSRGAHCVDEWDVMCYSDEPYQPKMRYLCDDGPQDFRYDCNNDDYFAANPAPGSYLSRHWNMANSIYLTSESRPNCVDVAFEPDDAYWYDFWEVPMRRFAVGSSEAHAFCAQPGDTDWILFAGQRGKTYQVTTSDLAPGVDTQLVVYRGFEEQHWGGMDPIAVNDDRAEGDPSSQATFTAPADATYLVGVSEAQGRAGYDLTYTLAVSAVAAPGVAELTLSRHSAKPQGTFTATMTDLTPAATVTVWLQYRGQATSLGEMTADGTGVATGTFSIPKGAFPGKHQIEAIASDSRVASAGFKVLDQGGKQGSKAGKRGGSHHGRKHGS